MRVALVHDYLAQDGGAERVLASLHELWPEAPIFVLFHDRAMLPQFSEADVRESFLGRFPFIRSHFQWYLPLMPLATERLRLDGFDIVISSTSMFAKGVITSPDTLHISYCHTPARFLWSDTHDYVSDLPYNPLIKLMLPRLLSHLRLWDTLSVDRVDHFVANSKTVERRINKYYRRESAVINPPVNVDNFKIAPQLGNYFVTGGRLVPYKNFAIVIKAFNRLQWPLKIFGVGPEYKRLAEMARPNIEFLGRIPEADKAKLLSEARAFIHPQIEDFGITPIEAMASGRPVIALGQGGAAETVVPGVSGVFIKNQNWEAVLDAVLHFDSLAWNPDIIRNQTGRWHPNVFRSAMQRFVTDRYEEFTGGLQQHTLLAPVLAPSR